MVGDLGPTVVEKGRGQRPRLQVLWNCARRNQGGEDAGGEIGVELEEGKAGGFFLASDLDLLSGGKGVELGFVGSGSDAGENHRWGGGGGEGEVEHGGESAGIGGVEHGGDEVEVAVANPSGPVLSVFGGRGGSGVDGGREADGGVGGAEALGEPGKEIA